LNIDKKALTLDDPYRISISRLVFRIAPHPIAGFGASTKRNVLGLIVRRDFVMRFALIATAVAALVATPLALSAVGPSMSPDAFLGAARCAGYQSILPATAEPGWMQAGLNAEARRQPAAIAAKAGADINAIATRAASVRTPDDVAALRMAREAACGGGAVADQTDALSVG